MIFLNEAGVRVIAAGHEATERVILKYLKESIRERFPGITVNIAQGIVF